eukprot:363259-Pyramimonas_sp.AAC.1
MRLSFDKSFNAIIQLYLFAFRSARRMEDRPLTKRSIAGRACPSGTCHSRGRAFPTVKINT